MIARRTLTQTDRCRQRGFTLLEVMLSLTLAVVLLGAIYAAMDQSWRLTASGREEMQRSQIARALLRKIALDVRAVMFVPPPPGEDESSDSSSSTSSSSSSSSSTSAPSGSSSAAGSSTTDATSTTSSTTEEPSAKSIGIRGTSLQIELHVSRARRDLNFSTDADGNKNATPTSDLKAITYSLATSGSTGTTGTGLIRTEGDRLMVQAIEEKGGLAAQASNSQVLAPEVVSLAFRYFDGISWYETWDSETAGYLPRAVEVTLAFAPPKTQGGPLLNVAVSSSANQFRTVIMVPVADPLPPELVP